MSVPLFEDPAAAGQGAAGQGWTVTATGHAGAPTQAPVTAGPHVTINGVTYGPQEIQMYAQTLTALLMLVILFVQVVHRA